VGGMNGGGSDDGCHEASEPATDRSPSPSSCRISAISDRTHVGSLGGSLGGWRCRLHFAGGACWDGLVVAPAPLPAAPTAAFFAAACVWLPAVTAFVIAAAAVVAAAAILFAAAVGRLPAVAASAVATMAAAVAALSSAGSMQPAGLERRLRHSTQAARLRFSCARSPGVYVPAGRQAHASYS
jgi:hypothetical protein